MRPMFFAAGLALAAHTASAEAEDYTAPDGRTHVTLTNGCVYTQNLLRDDNAWSLIYTEAGTTTQCALTVHGIVANDTDSTVTTDIAQAPTTYVTKAQTEPTLFPRRARLTITPGYVVGVFR